jgi:DNA-binding response OmpR family regulator
MKIKGKKIIIVDDDESIRIFYSKILRDEGYEILAYPSCEHLLSVISANPPDLIILDLMLPWESGESFLSKIKNIKKFSDIPVIVVSGKPLINEEIQRMKNIGASDFMIKPVDVEELLEKSRAYIE